MFIYRRDFGGVIDPRESRFKNLSCLWCFTDELWTSKGHEMHFCLVVVLLSLLGVSFSSLVEFYKLAET